MRVSVVVCTYEEKRYADFCEVIESVLDQTYETVEIVLVVDGNQAVFERAHAEFGDYEDIVLHCNDENSGLSYSRTQGVELASGEVVAFLDDDAIARENWVEQLVAGYEQTDAIAVGGRMVPKWVADEPAFLPEEFYWLIGVDYEARLEDWTEVRNTFGSNMSFRMEVFEAVGGFDEQVGLTGDSQIQAEETELAMRMYDKFGRGMLYNSDAVVAHKVFGYRTDPQWLSNRAFWQGYSKYAVKNLDAEGPPSEEADFLTHLIVSSVPRRLAGLVRTPTITNGQQLVVLLVLTACVGIGYLYAALNQLFE
jgi:Glycosyltransferases, probably involved in cell wall biogenesis